MSYFFSCARIGSKSGSLSLCRLEPSALDGVVRSALSVAGLSRVRSSRKSPSTPSMPKRMPKTRLIPFALRHPSTTPTRLALMTDVGPPDWPMSALPFMC